jgi:hypothetical protein
VHVYVQRKFVPTYYPKVSLLNEITSEPTILRKLAPELFSSTAQDALMYYLLVRYRLHWCRHIAHVLLDSIQVQKMWKFIKRVWWGLYFGVEGYFSQKVQNLKASASSKKSSTFSRINKYFTYIINDTSSWGLKLTQMLHSTNFSR